MEAVILQAHFDGDRILLDEPFDLEPDTRLIVTVVPKQQADDGERRDWLLLSQRGLQGAYAEDEPEYPLHLLKEVNPDYAGR